MAGFSFTQQGATPQGTTGSGNFFANAGGKPKVIGPQLPKKTKMSKPPKNSSGLIGYGNQNKPNLDTGNFMDRFDDKGITLNNIEGIASGKKKGLLSNNLMWGSSPSNATVKASPQTSPSNSGTSGGSSGAYSGAQSGSSPFGHSTPTAPSVPQGPAQGTPQYYANQVSQAGQMTPLEKQYIDQSVKAKNLQNYNSVAPYAEAQFYNAGTGQVPDVRAPDLEGRAAGTQGLASNLAGIYSNSALTGLTAANTIAERGLTGATTNLNAALPQTISPGQTAYNPLQGQNIPGIGGNAFQGGVQQGNVALGQNYAQMNAAHAASQGIRGQVQQYLAQNQNLNPSAFTNVNAALQFLNGQVGNAQYQTLSNLINEYISTLAPVLGVGGDTTNLKTQIAQSFVNAQANGQSINDVLTNIDALAKTKLEAIAQAGQGGYSSGSTGGGGFAETW